MLCPACKTTNEVDAEFCSECGKPMTGDVAAITAKSRRPYIFLAALVFMLALVAGVGYYKFFLPDGIAAVVNGEEIKLSEIDAAVSRMQVTRNAADSGSRYRMLTMLITQRLALQEAVKAGMQVSREEIAAAVSEARSSAGDESAFKQKVVADYGSMKAFEEYVQQRLLISRFIATKVVPPNADPQTARAAVDQWMQNISEKASVRIALAEQGPDSGAGCGCCNKKETTAVQPNKQACARPVAVAVASENTAPQTVVQDKTKAAQDAALAYWRKKHGPDAVTAKVSDFGCHMQVDIVKNGNVIGSLRYQNGNISE